MGFRRTDRLSDLVKLKALILVTCCACNHQAWFSPADTLQFMGADMDLGALPFRCSRCSSGAVKVSADPKSLLDGTGGGPNGPRKPEPL
jgi:hypothetical protein